MPFDANLVLRDGSVDLDNAEAVATSLTANDDGAKAIDLGTTTRVRGNAEGAMRIVASAARSPCVTSWSKTIIAWGSPRSAPP